MKTTFALSAMALLATAACAPHHHDHMKEGDKMFAEIDANKDGIVTQAEWVNFGNTQWAETDQNRDGMITKSEWDAQCAREHADRDGRPTPPPAPAPYAAAPVPYSTTTTTYAQPYGTTTYAPAYVAPINQPRTASTVRPASEGYGRNEATVNGSNDPQSRMPYARTHN